ncbi:MAG TPA: lipopolysaccharide assembly protein LapA domain-containing protein [Acidocella sp.]|nr:lipopolysaccharide assembly protein LapA domain-containing protein [Acidocella sp.]
MRAIIGFLVLLALVIFLLSNRLPVPVGFWPFNVSLSLPFGAVVLAGLLLGFFIGLLAHLPKRISASRRANRAEKRVAELEGKLAATPLNTIR